MDQEASTKELSEKTGHWIDEIRYDDSDAIREIMYPAYSPTRNVGFTFSVSPSLISDKMFDMVEHINREMGQCCERGLKWRGK